MKLSSKIIAGFVGASLFFVKIGAKEVEMQFKEPTEVIQFESGKKYYAEITTNKGKIVCLLCPEKAPLSVTNFKQLIEGHFYDGLTFHRVVPNFVVQGRDPLGTGRGGPGYTIPSEISLPHESGSLAWARLPDAVNPARRSSGSQFYITLEKTSFLDGEYTVFGNTVEGFDVVKKITQGDKIEKIQFFEREN